MHVYDKIILLNKYTHKITLYILQIYGGWGLQWSLQWPRLTANSIAHMIDYRYELVVLVDLGAY